MTVKYCPLDNPNCAYYGNYGVCEGYGPEYCGADDDEYEAWLQEQNKKTAEDEEIHYLKVRKGEIVKFPYSQHRFLRAQTNNNKAVFVDIDANEVFSLTEVPNKFGFYCIVIAHSLRSFFTLYAR